MTAKRELNASWSTILGMLFMVAFILSIWVSYRSVLMVERMSVNSMQSVQMLTTAVNATAANTETVKELEFRLSLIEGRVYSTGDKQ